MILRELSTPTAHQPAETERRPKRDFGPVPASLSAADWSPQEFRQRGFPYNPLPTKPVSILKTDQWDITVQHLLNTGKIVSGSLPILDEVRGWLADGCPPYLTSPGTIPTEAPHHIEAHEVQMVSTNTSDQPQGLLQQPSLHIPI